MSDPNRLLDDPNLGGFDRALLGAAAGDGPDPAGRQRVAKRLGIAAGLASSTVAGGSAVATVLTATAIVIGLGGVLGMAVSRSNSTSPAVVTSTVELPRSTTARSQPLAITAPPVAVAASPPVTAAPPSPAIAASPPVIVARTPAPSRIPVASPTVTSPSRIAIASPTIASPSRVITAPAPTAPAPPPPMVTAPPFTVTAPPPPEITAPPPTIAAPPPDLAAPPPVTSTIPDPSITTPAPPPATPVPIDARRLAAEVASLDRAREQLRRHDAGAALALLDRHDREFGGGVLIAEATVVRLEALILRGSTADARTLADSFLARFPRSPLVQRVRSLRDSVVQIRR